MDFVGYFYGYSNYPFSEPLSDSLRVIQCIYIFNYDKESVNKDEK